MLAASHAFGALTSLLLAWAALGGVLVSPSLRWPFLLFNGQCLMRGLLTVFVAALCLAPGGGGEGRVAALFATLGGATASVRWGCCSTARAPRAWSPWSRLGCSSWTPRPSCPR